MSRVDEKAGRSPPGFASLILIVRPESRTFLGYYKSLCEFLVCLDLYSYFVLTIRKSRYRITAAPREFNVHMHR